MNTTTAAAVVRNHPTAKFSNELTIDGHRFRRHQNGGGLVEDTAFVDPNVHVGRRAMVKDHAIVRGAVRLFGEAIACDFSVKRSPATAQSSPAAAHSATMPSSPAMPSHATPYK